MMTKDEFKSFEEKYGLTIEFIRHEAHELHQSVNQIYGDNLPYGFHLDMVVEMISKYGHLVCACENDLLPLFFGGFFHDSIEDARLSYNDVMKRAKKILTDDQALMATEIVSDISEAEVVVTNKNVECGENVQVIREYDIDKMIQLMNV